MNAKISLPELIDLLSRKNNCTKKEAEQFLKEFFSLAADTVARGENLKINGLGQFRSVWVEPRASVNVRTGEPMEIPGHYKLSFAPDKAMREAVNAPFSCFIPEVLPDDALPDEIVAGSDVESLDEGDEESADLMTDEAAAPESGTAADGAAEPVMAESAVANATVPTDDMQTSEVAEQESITEEKDVEAASEPLSETGSSDKPAPDVANDKKEDAEDAKGKPEECEEEEIKNLSEEELDALADFVFGKIVAESQAAEGDVAQQPNGEDTATAVEKPEVEFSGEIACEPQPGSESCEPETGARETAVVDEVTPATSSEATESESFVAKETEAVEYEEDEEDDYAPSMWDKMQRRPLLTTLCAILLLLLVVAGGALWNLNRRGITLGDAWSYYFPTEQPATPTAVATPETPLADEETPADENNQAPAVVSEKETTPVATPVDVQALPPIAMHRLDRGDRLTLLALEFYGSKDFWVYIYEENKEVMPNPNRLSIGLEVKIPDPRKYDIDASSPSSLAKAKAFADALNEKFD